MELHYFNYTIHFDFNRKSQVYSFKSDFFAYNEIYQKDTNETKKRKPPVKKWYQDKIFNH